jgi:5-hydroxyisourate hydrolase-like protein (transthyretin family)
MADYTEILLGTVLRREDGSPIGGATVEVYDKDLLSSDHLGTTNTDESGRFRVAFQWSDYKSLFEGRPDIFLKVTDPGSGKHMKSQVYEEVRGTLDDADIETMDLGDVLVD